MCHVFRLSDNADTNGEDTSSLSSEEEKDGAPPVSEQSLKPSWMSLPQSQAPASTDRREEEEEEEDIDGEEGSCLPTIFFSHTVEPKKVRLIFVKRKIHSGRALPLSLLCHLFQVRINTGKNTTLKFSERKEQKEHSKRKRKNSHSNGHSHHELHKITTPADIYR